MRYAESLWRMRRHGPVIAHCTDSEDFPKQTLALTLILFPSTFYIPPTFNLPVSSSLFLDGVHRYANAALFNAPECEFSSICDDILCKSFWFSYHTTLTLP